MTRERNLVSSNKVFGMECPLIDYPLPVHLHKKVRTEAIEGSFDALSQENPLIVMKNNKPDLIAKYDNFLQRDGRKDPHSNVQHEFHQSESL